LSLSVVSKICDALAIVKPDTIVRWHARVFGVLVLEVETPRWPAHGAARKYES